MMDSPPTHTPDAEARILVSQWATARLPLARLWISRATGLVLLGQGIMIAPFAAAFALADIGITRRAWAISLVSMAFSCLGFYLLTPRFSLLFLRHFGDDSVGKRVRSLLPRHLTPYFKVLALYDPKTNPVFTGLANGGGFSLAGLIVALLTLGLRRLIPGFPFLPLWLHVSLLFLLGRPIARRFREHLSRSASYTVSSRENLAATLQGVEGWIKRRLVARKVRVISVVPELWQEVVSELAARTDVVIFDMSIVSEGVVWEVESLLPRLGGRAILFGLDEAVQEWLYRESSTAGDLVSRIRPCLSGRQVLVERADWRGAGRFQRELSRAALSSAIGAKNEAAARSSTEPMKIRGGGLEAPSLPPGESN